MIEGTRQEMIPCKWMTLIDADPIDRWPRVNHWWFH